MTFLARLSARSVRSAARIGVYVATASPIATRHFSASTRVSENYGFIGLGRMGYPMAENLARSLSSQDTLTLFDVNSSALSSFESLSDTLPCKISLASSSTEAILASSTIISMLPNTSHVESLFESFLSSSPSPSKASTTPSEQLKNKLFIDSSTISPASTKLLSDSLASHGATLIDAPVSGGVVGAQSRSLTFMISHPPSIPLSRIETLLSYMGKRIIVCGSYAGAGLAAKLANNYALALNNIATCDAMLLGQKLGLDPKVLAQVLNTSTGRSWPSEANNPVPNVLDGKVTPSCKNYEGGFGIGLMRKDLDLALEADQKAEIVTAGSRTATATGSSSSSSSSGGGGKLSKLSQVALEVYKEVERDQKYQGKDFSVVYQYLKDLE